MSDQNDPKNITTAIDDRFYKLVDRTPMHCTLAEFVEAMKDEKNRIIEQTMIGDLQVSTVFTGIDQNWANEGDPILFDTVVFGLPDDLRPQWSFSSWDESMEIHNLIVQVLTEHGIEPLLEEIRKKAEEQGVTTATTEPEPDA